ncbi:npr-23 [Pristionchus pacificus]|uniref:Npr-23 n=1 Tax=Pristionchus pacificus TaxID=54126 RepID=A0A2A6CEL5_PRIPA|nr:npr-23 [Pristionchus pacificus]|eukprot:PDM76537.1 npr-23 [Pristionchus pacificus]
MDEHEPPYPNGLPTAPPGFLLTTMFPDEPIEIKYENLTHAGTPQPMLALTFTGITLLSVVANLVVLIYIIYSKLYHNFISSHFIAHLCLTNIICAVLCLPMFIYTVHTGENIWKETKFLCNMQALLTCVVWTVGALMALCIAGVHLLTFARIHYEQLFGLPPNMLCGLSWIISICLALPAITNAHVVTYDSGVRQCIWGSSDHALKFLTYILILGVLIPTLFMYYAYIRVIGILYHSPVVFQALGLYNSRWLVFGFLLTPFYQIPFYLTTVLRIAQKDPDAEGPDPILPIIFMYLAYGNCLVSPFLYGASLFLIKEEDMALTVRAHKAGAGGGATYHHPNSAHHHPAGVQAQLI